MHADLPPFSKPGQTIDITVSSIGNAQSLRGGSLLMTPLRGADGEVYAIAQGSLVVGGFGVSGKDGSRIALNVPSAGRIPNGATVEKVPTTLARRTRSSSQPAHAGLHHVRASGEGINKLLGDDIARGDRRRVGASACAAARVRAHCLSLTLENIEIEPGDRRRASSSTRAPARWSSASHVRVMPAAVAHGSLS